MKSSLCFFCFFVLGFNFSHSQTNIYHPFPENGAVWNYSLQYPCQILLVYHTYSLVLDGDTIIGSNTYHKLNIPFVNTWSQETGCPPFPWGLGYNGGIRQDTAARKVFFIYPSDSVEYVLYDFSLQVGDTVHGLITPWFCAVVTAVDSIQLPDGWRKKWHYATDAGPEEIVEGIGNIPYGLRDIICLTLDSRKSWLECFAQNGQTFYPDSNGACIVIDALAEYSTHNANLQVFPNPAANQLSIGSAYLELNNIEIYNVLGEIIYSSAVDCSSCIVNIEYFTSGIYFIKAFAGEKVLLGKIIKE